MHTSSAPRPVDIPHARLMTFAELRRLNYEETEIAAALRSRNIVRVRHGVYASAAFWRTLKPWDRDVWAVRAHHLSARSDLIYTHVSAARLWGMDVWNATNEIHVTQGTRHGDNSAGVVRHKLIVPDEQVMTLDGLRLTSKERTVVDCAKLLPHELATVIADSALHRGASRQGVSAILEEQTGYAHISKARRVLAAANPLSESAGETRLRLKVMQWGFPPPVLQYEIDTTEGRYRADLAWPELMLILEFDGDTKYNGKAPTDFVLLEERKRETALMESGWCLVRVRWPQLDHEASLRNRILRAYNNAVYAYGRPPAA